MKPMRSALLALIVCAACSSTASAAGQAKPPVGRDASIINAFQVMCTLQLPDLDHLSGQANAMRMKAIGDDTSTTPTGETIRSKAWFGMLTSGPFALRAEQMRGVKGVSTSCAIEGTVANVAAFRVAAIETLRLGTSSEQRTIEGSHATYWDGYAGQGSTLVLSEMERPAGHFVELKLLNMVKAAPAVQQ
jgi:invasion protein IalB